MVFWDMKDEEKKVAIRNMTAAISSLLVYLLYFFEVRTMIYPFNVMQCVDTRCDLPNSF